MFSIRRAALDEALGGPRTNAVFAAVSFEMVSDRVRDFPRDEEGLLFDGVVLPCFGLWRGIDGPRRDALAARVKVHRHRGPRDFAFELLDPRDERRVVLAHFPASTLGEAAQGVTARLAEGVGRWGRWRRRDRVGPDDVLRVPPLHLVLDDDVGSIAVRLDTEAEAEPPPQGLTQGRGEMYDRYFQLNEPFIVWIGRGTDMSLVAWLGAPSPRS